MHIGLNAHLLARQSGYRTAGIHGYMVHLLNHLAAEAPEGWQFTALVNRDWTDQFPGVHLSPSHFNTASPLRRILWEQAAQPFQLSRFDAYHALAFIAPALLMRPGVVTLYDLSFVHYPERLPMARRLYLTLFARLTCQRARRVIAISQATADDAAATWNLPPDRIDIAAPGVDPGIFRPLPDTQVTEFRQRKALPDRFWLFVGTLEPRKNLVMLLEAYAALRPGERLPLVLAGGKGWDYQPIFDAVDRHQLRDQVHFPGFIPSDELPLWYNSAETFIYPSVFEGFGLPVLEAMACGTPVVAADASSLAEIARGAGVLVNAGDESAWTAALQRAGGDDTWRLQASEQGLRRAADYSWANTARNTILSYKKAFHAT
jgi:glycosyltransferase involved in cell wall biosynthesis